MSQCNVPTNTISILEKINRLTQLFDPWLMPIELVQLYAQNLGYDVGLNREQIPTMDNADPAEAQIEQGTLKSIDMAFAKKVLEGYELFLSLQKDRLLEKA